MRVFKQLSELKNKHLVVLMSAKEKEEAEDAAVKNGSPNLSVFIRDAVAEKVGKVNKLGVKVKA